MNVQIEEIANVKSSLSKLQKEKASIEDLSQVKNQIGHISLDYANTRAVDEIAKLLEDKADCENVTFLQKELNRMQYLVAELNSK